MTAKTALRSFAFLIAVAGGTCIAVATRVTPGVARAAAASSATDAGGAQAAGRVADASPAPSLLITDAHVLDPRDRTEWRGHLLLENGVIRARLTEIPPGYRGARYDARGKWVIPGLVDLHVHSWGNPGVVGGALRGSQWLGTEGVARVMLRAGVTSFLDLFSDENGIFAIRDRQRAGEPSERGDGAEIFAAGPIFTCRGGHGTEYGVPARTVDSPEEARLQVADLARRRPDVIKLVYDHARALPSMNRDTMKAVIAGARAEGLKTVVHIGTWTDAAEAVDAGADVITHLYEGSEIPDELVGAMRDRGVISIPTMTVQEDLAQIVERPEILDRPLARLLAPDELLEPFRYPEKFSPEARKWLRWQKPARESYAHSLQKLRAGGVRLGVGTDSGNVGVFQGYSVHRELELLVGEGGLTSWEALAAATVTPAVLLGQRYGVAPGDFANLVVLEASPLANIANTQSIAAVILRGKLVTWPEGSAVR